MVLAAGRGTRLAPLTHTTPKPLVPVAGRPFLEHILEFLRAGGIRDVVVNLHHLGHRIEAHLGDGARFGVRIRYSWEDPILDTGGGIKHAEPLLAGEPFVVVNGDSLLDLALADVVAAHEVHGAVATLVVRPDPEAARYGLIELDADDRVRRIVGVPPDAPGPLRPYMFPGLHVFQPGIFAWMEPDGAYGITRVTYPRLLAAGVPIHGFVTDARWVNIDTPDALAAADRTLRGAPFRFARRKSGAAARSEPVATADDEGRKPR
jgi:NDP-sugar pyrophosphorylase family protein